MAPTPRSDPKKSSAAASPRPAARGKCGVGGAAAGGALDLLDDDALISEIRGGSEPHFNVLYERYFQRIYAFVYLRMRDHGEAEEITQETFTVVFRSAAGWSGRSTPLAWIYGIAKNTIANTMRRNRTHRERMEQAGPTPLVTTSPTWSLNPEEQFDLDRCAALMQERLGEMVDWQVEAFVMRHAHNLPIPEISKRTGRSSDAVRSGLYRVKKVLMETRLAEMPVSPTGSGPT